MRSGEAVLQRDDLRACWTVRVPVQDAGAGLNGLELA